MWIRGGTLVSEIKNSENESKVTVPILAKGLSLIELKQDIEDIELKVFRENQLTPFYNMKNNFKYVVWRDIQEI